MDRDGQRDCATEHRAVAPGESHASLSSALLPPFSPLGPDTLAVLLPLAWGEAPAESVALNHAIAAQIWLLFFGPEASAELARAGRAGFYMVLCALALGKAPPPPTPPELDRLRMALEREPPRNSSQRPGLLPLLYSSLRHDRELRGFAKEDAARRLLCRWREQPFTFVFGTSGGGGGGDPHPGGGGSGTQQAEGLAVPVATSSLDIRTRTLDAQLTFYACVTRRAHEHTVSLPSIREPCVSCGALVPK